MVDEFAKCVIDCESMRIVLATRVTSHEHIGLYKAHSIVSIGMDVSLSYGLLYEGNK